MNAGHKFTYIKSIVLQAITKYLYMKTRNDLPASHKRHMPLHRLRNFQSDRRRLTKVASSAVWYEDKEYKDVYRNQWKFWIRRKGIKNSKKGIKNSKKRRTNSKRTTTAIFVPQTPGSKLFRLIQGKEDIIAENMDRKVKIVEKPGVPLAKIFSKSFKMEGGCHRGEICICEGSGSSCLTKGVVYESVCKTCQNLGKGRYAYIGETARQVGTRAAEHINNLTQFKLDSFMLGHWLDQHPTDAVPPEFKFKIVSKHKDPLSRQIKEAVMISNQVLLNKRNEFIQNEIIKMQPSQFAWEMAKEDKNTKKIEAEREVLLKEFSRVMNNVRTWDGGTDPNMSNKTCIYYRSKQHKRKEATSLTDTKRARIMDKFSTPVNDRHTGFREGQSPDSSPISLNSVLNDSQDFGDSGAAGQNHTNISNEAENLRLKSKEQESLTQVLASQAITMESYSDAEYSYMVRRETGLANDTNLWGDIHKFKMYESDNSSCELEVLLNDYSLEWLFHHGNDVKDSSAVDQEKVFTNDFALEWLFQEEVDKKQSSIEPRITLDTSSDIVSNQFEDDNCFGLVRIFKEEEVVKHWEEEQIDEEVLVQLIERKRRNSLPEIFKKDNDIKLPSTPKRKRDSPEAQITNKLRRMTIAAIDNSPWLRKVSVTRNNN